MDLVRPYASFVTAQWWERYIVSSVLRWVDEGICPRLWIDNGNPGAFWAPRLGE